MPVAVFVILYSVPRFFELETNYERRSLCPTTATELTSNSTLDGNVTNDENDFFTTSNGSDGIVSTLSTPLSTIDPCPFYWEPQLGVKPLRFNKYYVSVSLI